MPCVFQALSVSDVRALMGSAVADLKVFENDSLVQAWISSQPQSQLDTLNVGLLGGRADPSTSAPDTVQNNNSTANSSSSQSTAPSQSAAATVTTQGKATPTLSDPLNIRPVCSH